MMAYLRTDGEENLKKSQREGVIQRSVCVSSVPVILPDKTWAAGQCPLALGTQKIEPCHEKACLSFCMKCSGRIP